MTNSSWFVLFPKDRVPSEQAVMAALSKIRGVKVNNLGEMVFTVAIGKTSFDVALNDKSYVAMETREAVERYGETLANRDEVNDYDWRFELLFDNRDMGDLFSELLLAAEKLAKLTNGVIFECTTGVFQ